MKLLRLLVLLLLGAGCGLVFGFLWRGKTSQSLRIGPVESSASSELGSQPSSRATSGSLATPASTVAEKLHRDLTLSKGVTRWLRWFEALDKAAPADYPALARLARNDKPALRFVTARWVQAYPRHLYDTLVAASQAADATLPVNELGFALFADWAKRDPDAAVAAVNEAAPVGSRADWRMQVASAIVETDPERGLKLMTDWHIENFGPRMTAVAKWAAADPRHAAEFTLQNASGYAARLTIETIGKEWAKSDPAAALNFAATKLDPLSSELAAAALKQWTDRNLPEAAAWLASVEPPTRNRLSPSFVESWGKQDSAAALKWCESNLTGTTLVQSVGGLLKGAAAKDIGQAAQLVSSMAPSLVRAEAAAQVAETWLPEFSSGKPVKAETITWLESLDPDSVRGVLNKVVWRWSSSDPKTLAAFLERQPNAKIPIETYQTLARQLSRDTPLEAVDWAARLPEQAAVLAGAAAFAEWRGSQPEAASKWLNDLPASDTRKATFFQRAIETLAHHPQAAEQFAAMNEADRSAARSVVEKMPDLTPDRQKALLAVLNRK
jgi:hypothetical protein